MQKTFADQNHSRTKPAQITYIANARLPTEKAHGVQIAKMCEAFARVGINLSLWLPRRFQVNPRLRSQDIFGYYSVQPIFAVEYLANLDTLRKPFPGKGLNTLAYIIQDASFALFAAWKARGTKGLLYTRSKLVAALRRAAVFEAHDPARETVLDRRVAVRSRSVVAITRSIEMSWRRLGARTLYAPDGVSEEFFQKLNRTRARQMLGLPLNGNIALYAGNFYPWKGGETLIAAAKLTRDVDIYLVGGSPVEKDGAPIRELARGAANVKFIDHQPYRLMPIWLRSADVLILPNTGKMRKGSEDTSPLKLFEYMASGRPILASRVPAVLEILGKKEATFFSPDDPQDLARQLAALLREKKTATVKARLARGKARRYTWEARATTLIRALTSGNAT